MENQDFVNYTKANYRVAKDGSIRNASNRVVLPGIVLKDYRFYAMDNGKSVDGVNEQTISEYFSGWSKECLRIAEEERKERKKARKEEDKGPPLGDIVSHYLAEEKSHWKISPTWSEVEYLATGPDSPPVCSDLENMAKMIYVWANRKGITTSKDAIHTYLSVLQMHMAAEVIENLFKDIGYDAAYVEDCDKILDGIHDLLKIRQSKEVFRTFMKHWMWQVKRKILGWEVVWEIWLNFYGASGVGKSRMIRELCKPLEEFYLEAMISVFADATRERDKFTRYYILNFDELTVGGTSSRYLGDTEACPEDVQRAIKQFTTQKKMTSRTMGGQNQATRRVTFNPISSANEHLYDIIFDANTMRRFFEINCDMSLDETDKQYYERKDALQQRLAVVWKGVDESLENGYWNQDCPVWEETREVQKNYYPTKTTTSLWVDDEGVVAGGESHSLDMYHDYADWCKERGYKARSMRSWVEDVQHIIEGAKEEHRNINISYRRDG